MKRTNRETFGGQGYLPPTPNGQHLCDYLEDLGFCEESDGGSLPISYPSIKAWNDLLEIELTPFEAKAVRLASKAFVIERTNATAAQTQPPYFHQEDPEQAKARRAALARGIRDALSGKGSTQ